MIARCVLLALCLAATSAPAEDWSGRVTVYGWLPTAEIDTSLNTPTGVLGDSASAGFDDILDALNFAAFGTLEVRRGSLGLIGDLVYTDLGIGSTGAGGVRRSLGLSLFMGTAAVAWRAWEDDAVALDLLAGGRVVSADVDFSRRGALVSVRAARSTTWVDPLVGLRAGYAVSDRVAVTALGNIGGFGVGSELTWELFGGVSYAFTDSVRGELGYRYLSIDYDNDGVELDIRLHGPVLGLTFVF